MNENNFQVEYKHLDNKEKETFEKKNKESEEELSDRMTVNEKLVKKII